MSPNSISRHIGSWTGVVILPSQRRHYKGEFPQNLHIFALFDPPKIGNLIPDGGRMNSPILKHYVSCRKTASSRGLRRLRIFHLLDGLGALYADLFLHPFQVIYPYNMFCPQHLHWNPFKTKKHTKKNSKVFEFFNCPKYPDPSKVAILKALPLLYKFKPFHWRVPADP